MNPGPLRNPLVSVVIAAYQAERFLADAIESVRAQTFRPWELVVVDDGSTDGTEPIARQFPEVRLFVLARNQGIAAARNEGVASATGELITFLDADDLMFPNRLEVQVRYLIDHPRCRCVLSRHEVMVEEGDSSSWLPRDSVYGDLGGVEPGSAMLWADLARAIPFKSTYRVGEGLEWLGRVADLAGPIDVCPEPLWYRRIHDGNQSRNRAALRVEMLRMARSRIEEGRARPDGG